MDGKSAYGNPYLFTGRRVDILDNGSLKIQYNRSRYYDYYTGRWTTHDPLGMGPAGGQENRFYVLAHYSGSLSLCEYVMCRPGIYLDSLGLTSECLETNAKQIEVEWYCGRWQPLWTPRFAGKNRIARGLEAKAKKDCCEFVGPVLIKPDITKNRILWSG